MNSNTYDRFVEEMQAIADLEHAVAVLSWDKEVNLPPKGAPTRSRQVATLSGMAHDRFTSDEMGQLLETLTAADQSAFSLARQRNITLTLREYRKARKLDSAFVIRRSQAISNAYHAWLKARQANDFHTFEPALREVIAIKREEAERLGYEEHPYDALLDQYEPEYRSRQLDILFADVKEQLVAFTQVIRSQPQVDDRFLFRNYPHQAQWDFGLAILRQLGYDFEAGRQDVSPHPFTIRFGPGDVRVTTRVDEHNFSTMLWSSIHEAGHALYEQGLPADEYGLPMGSAVSLGIHESQSRLWENQIGRSLDFWIGNLPLAQKFFPDQLADITPEAFFRGINKIYPHPIRIESDELHYHFHILIRYEIEKGLIEGSMSTADIPGLWREKYRSYLGLDIADDLTGPLQDIHWAHGSIGYFPTYSLGSFYAAQFYAQANRDIPGLAEKLRAGDPAPLLGWLQEKIFSRGRLYSADDLCRHVTGETLQFRYFMDYAREKYSRIYGL